MGAGIGGTGFHQLFKPVFAIERHDFITRFIIHSMQRNREIDPDFLTTAQHHRHHTGGGQGDAAAGKLDAFLIHHDLQGFFHMIEIIKRLAHAHHHDIGDPAIIGAGRPFPQIIAGHHHLRHNFTGGEIAHQLHRAGMAKAAIKGAAHLT